MLKRDDPRRGPTFGDCYRTIPETRIVALLAFAGWPPGADDPAALPVMRHALQRWIDHGLAYRTGMGGERLFDPVEVWTVMKRLGRAGLDAHLRDRHAVTGRRLVADLAASPAREGPFTMEFSRTFGAGPAPSARRLRLRLPLALAQAHPDRSILFLGDADRDQVTIQDDRLEVRAIPSGEPLRLSVRLAFSAPRDSGIGTDRDLYLRPREGPIVVSDRVHDLAQSLARQGSSVVQAARAFWTYLIEDFVCGPIHHDQVDPLAPCDWVIARRAYDCRLGAALFAALCRARGIPARIVGGQLLYRRAPTNHFWAEYWCDRDGWTPVDFLGWDVSCGGADPGWRDHFFGRVDCRLVTERLPLAYTGPPGVPIPRQWHLLQSGVPGGVEIALMTLAGGRVFTDVVRLLD